MAASEPFLILVGGKHLFRVIFSYPPGKVKPFPGGTEQLEKN
jgi:hypothetical protein